MESMGMNAADFRLLYESKFRQEPSNFSISRSLIGSFNNITDYSINIFSKITSPITCSSSARVLPQMSLYIPSLLKKHSIISIFDIGLKTLSNYFILPWFKNLVLELLFQAFWMYSRILFGYFYSLVQGGGKAKRAEGRWVFSRFQTVVESTTSFKVLRVMNLSSIIFPILFPSFTLLSKLYLPAFVFLLSYNLIISTPKNIISNTDSIMKIGVNATLKMSSDKGKVPFSVIRDNDIIPGILDHYYSVSHVGLIDWVSDLRVNFPKYQPLINRYFSTGCKVDNFLRSISSIFQFNIYLLNWFHKVIQIYLSMKIYGQIWQSKRTSAALLSIDKRVRSYVSRFFHMKFSRKDSLWVNSYYTFMSIFGYEKSSGVRFITGGVIPASSGPGPAIHTGNSPDINPFPSDSDSVSDDSDDDFNLLNELNKKRDEDSLEYFSSDDLHPGLGSEFDSSLPVSDRIKFTVLRPSHFDDVVFEYSNSQIITICDTEHTEVNGVEVIGVSNTLFQPRIPVYKDSNLANYIVDNYATPIEVCKYHVPRITNELLADSMSKYVDREKVDLTHICDPYLGSFSDFAENWLDYFYGYTDGEVIDKVDITSFTSERCLTPNSRKSYPGVESRALGIKTKDDNLTLSIERAKAMWSEAVNFDSVTHYWGLIEVPKKCKRSEERMRIAFAPDMPWFIIQHTLFSNFISHCENKSKVTNEFQLFFGGFDDEIKKLSSNGRSIEGSDFKDFGGRVGASVHQIFIDWYGKKFSSPEDELVFRAIMDDSLNSKVITSTISGGLVYQTRSGWKDGAYGTTYVDSILVMIGWLYSIFKQLSIYPFNSDNELISPLSVPKFIRASIHGDNVLTSYPYEYSQYLSIVRGKEHFEDLGWILSESTTGSITNHELMGFKIKPTYYNGEIFYVGYRDFEKTIRSLIYRRRKFSSKDRENSYILSIIDCLTIVDSHNDKSRRMLGELSLRYPGVSDGSYIGSKPMWKLPSTKYEIDPRHYWYPLDSNFMSTGYNNNLFS